MISGSEKPFLEVICGSEIANLGMISGSEKLFLEVIKARMLAVMALMMTGWLRGYLF